MDAIKNFHKFSGSRTIGPRSLISLDEAAALHLRFSNITFKVISASPDGLIIQTRQGKHLSENYADANRLVELTKELFTKFINDTVPLTVHPVPYIMAITEVVDPQWISENMLKLGVKIKDISTDTGIDKTNLSAWINGVRPMSQPVKAMFYYFIMFRRTNQDK